jgi:hypothetical protein
MDMRAICLLVAISSCTSGSDTVVIKMDGLTVQPGQEIYKCQNFANPFGKAVDIDRFEAHMTPGAHHMIVFFVDNITNGGLEDCSGSEFHGNVFGAQVPDSVIDLPSGIGVAIPAKTGLRLQLHFVNATNKPLPVSVTTQYHVASNITQHAGQLIFSNEDINVPPGSTAPVAVTKSCAVPSDLSLLGASAHVHQHAVDFVAETNGTQLYHFAGGPEATPARFAPPIPMAANQGITWTCSYVNDTGAPLVFGESAVTNEMCVFGAIYYPVADTTFPNIPCF